MKKQERLEIYNEALDKWGEDAQLFVSVEEFSELIQVICKILAKKKWNKRELIGELADCRIMIEQLENMILHGDNSEVKKEMSRKLDKLNKRIKSV